MSHGESSDDSQEYLVSHFKDTVRIQSPRGKRTTPLKRKPDPVATRRRVTKKIEQNNSLVGNGDNADIWSQQDVLEDDILQETKPHNKKRAINYFIGISNRKETSSGHVLEIEEVDESKVNYLESEIAMTSLRAKNVSQFAEIFLLLKEKFTVMLYGFGSKRKLLHSFCEKFLADEHYLMINGYFPALTYRDVANQLKDALQASGTDRDSLVDAVENLDHDFFLVIHSIDMLLSSPNDRIKPLLVDLLTSQEGRVDKFHLIATVDHVNSGLLFDSSTRTKVDMVWIEMKTYIPYTIERGYTLSSDNATATAKLTLNSILHVYGSLTPNAQKIFLQILDYCVEKKRKLLEERRMLKEFRAAKANKKKDKGKTMKRGRGKSRRFKVIEEESDDEEMMEIEDSDEEGDLPHQPPSAKINSQPKAEDEGLPLATLYRICREEYLVNSEITLKAQLTEFQDHNIIKIAKASDGSPIIRLLIALSLAESFLTKVREQS